MVNNDTMFWVYYNHGLMGYQAVDDGLQLSVINHFHSYWAAINILRKTHGFGRWNHIFGTRPFRVCSILAERDSKKKGASLTLRKSTELGRSDPVTDWEESLSRGLGLVEKYEVMFTESWSDVHRGLGQSHPWWWINSFNFTRLQKGPKKSAGSAIF